MSQISLRYHHYVKPGDFEKSSRLHFELFWSHRRLAPASLLRVLALDCLIARLLDLTYFFTYLTLLF